MSRLQTGPLVSAALISGFLTVVSLVFPWFEIFGKQRSSIDLVTSASALDVIEGLVKVLVIIGWLLAPVLVSIAMFLAASGRHRIAAALLLPIGVAFFGVAFVGLVVGDITLAWGAIFGAVFAALATVFAIMVVVTPKTRS